jgi:hypothetical protein
MRTQRIPGATAIVAAGAGGAIHGWSMVMDGSVAHRRDLIFVGRLTHQRTTAWGGTSEAMASANAIHFPSGTTASATTKQNTAKLHIPGRKPCRNRMTLGAPCWTWVNTRRMARAAGKAVNAPLRVGPSHSARLVSTSTTVTEVRMRSGRSQAERSRAMGAPRDEGSSARTRKKLPTAATSASGKDQRSALSASVTMTKLAQLATRLGHQGRRSDAQA